MGRNMGIEPMHTGATIRRVNHFTNSAISNYFYILTSNLKNSKAFFIYIKIFNNKLNVIHIIIPQKVGINMERIVHFHEFVSFFIVRHVVEQGQCINEKIITDIAV